MTPPNKPTHREQLIRQLDGAIETWLLDCSYENRSPKTVSFYREFTRPFVDHVGGDIQVADITEAQVRAYFGKVSTEYVKSSRFRALRVFFNWCKRQHYISESPLVLHAPKVRDRVKETFTTGDRDRMLRACAGRCLLRDRAIVWMFWDTGCRLGEMERMEEGHISLDARLVRVIGKGNKERMVSFSLDCRKAVWEYLKAKPESKHLWISNKGGFFSARGMHLMIRRLILKSKIGFRASPHTFRHSLAVRLLSAEVSPLDVQYILGHTSLEMVRRYSRHHQEQRAIEAMRRVQG